MMSTTHFHSTIRATCKLLAHTSKTRRLQAEPRIRGAKSTSEWHEKGIKIWLKCALKIIELISLYTRAFFWNKIVQKTPHNPTTSSCSTPSFQKNIPPMQKGNSCCPSNSRKKIKKSHGNPQVFQSNLPNSSSAKDLQAFTCINSITASWNWNSLSCFQALHLPQIKRHASCFVWYPLISYESTKVKPVASNGAGDNDLELLENSPF